VYTGHESYVVASFKNKNTLSISRRLLAKITMLGKLFTEGTVTYLVTYIRKCT